MKYLTSLPKKTAIRSKLIFACLAVSLLVSAIYVTVSYRLTSDVNMQAEVKSMRLLLSLIGREINNTGPLQTVPLNTIKDLISEDETGVLVHIRQSQETYTISHNFDKKVIEELMVIINKERENEPTDEPLITLRDESYLWSVASEDSFTIFCERGCGT